MPGLRCQACGEWHDELPFAFHAEAPRDGITPARVEAIAARLLHG